MRVQLPFTLVAAIFASSLIAIPAQAQSNRTFVSRSGVDNSTCSYTSPCRTFQGAYNVTNAGGEIDVLDPAGYGELTISHAIDINGHGWASITASANTDAITITASGSDQINIRGVLIDGAGADYNGIVLNAAGSLTVTNCTLQNFFASNSASSITGIGILMQPTSGMLNFTITNTTVSNNGLSGIFYLPPSGTPSANGVIDHVVTNGNGESGIDINTSEAIGGTTIVTISNSIAKGNNYGISLVGNTPSEVSIDAVSVSGNTSDGIGAGGAVNILLGRSVITGNGPSSGSIGSGIFNNTTSNTFCTYGDNRINLNGDGSGGTQDISSPLNTSYKPQ